MTRSKAQGSAGDGAACWPDAQVVEGGSAVGLTAGTHVAGPSGWIRVEDLQSGDQVLTFDHRLQPLSSVETGLLWPGNKPVPPPLQPLAVPLGRLGNAAEVLLLPAQHVLLESDAAQAMFGDPFALVPAACLDGFRGIKRVAPEDPITMVELRFASDQLVFGAIGALLHCASADRTTSLFASPFSAGYRVLAKNEALALVARMSREKGYFDEPFDPHLTGGPIMRIVSR